MPAPSYHQQLERCRRRAYQSGDRRSGAIYARQADEALSRGSPEPDARAAGGVVGGSSAAPDETAESARLEACLAALLGAETDEEFAQAKRDVARIRAMTDGEVMALRPRRG